MFVISPVSITVTLLWARWRLKSPIVCSTVCSGADQRKKIKARRHWPLWGEFTVTGEFPAHWASNTGNIPIWWRHYEVLWHLYEYWWTISTPYVYVISSWKIATQISFIGHWLGNPLRHQRVVDGLPQITWKLYNISTIPFQCSQGKISFIEF